MTLGKEDVRGILRGRVKELELEVDFKDFFGFFEFFNKVLRRELETGLVDDVQIEGFNELRRSFFNEDAWPDCESLQDGDGDKALEAAHELVKNALNKLDSILGTESLFEERQFAEGTYFYDNLIGKINIEELSGSNKAAVHQAFKNLFELCATLIKRERLIEKDDQEALGKFNDKKRAVITSVIDESLVCFPGFGSALLKLNNQMNCEMHPPHEAMFRRACRRVLARDIRRCVAVINQRFEGSEKHLHNFAEFCMQGLATDPITEEEFARVDALFKVSSLYIDNGVMNAIILNAPLKVRDRIYDDVASILDDFVDFLYGLEVEIVRADDGLNFSIGGSDQDDFSWFGKIEGKLSGLGVGDEVMETDEVDERKICFDVDAFLKKLYCNVSEIARSISGEGFNHGQSQGRGQDVAMVDFKDEADVLITDHEGDDEDKEKVMEKFLAQNSFVDIWGKKDPYYFCTDEGQEWIFSRIKVVQDVNELYFLLLVVSKYMVLFSRERGALISLDGSRIEIMRSALKKVDGCNLPDGKRLLFAALSASCEKFFVDMPDGFGKIDYFSPVVLSLNDDVRGILSLSLDFAGYKKELFNRTLSSFRKCGSVPQSIMDIVIFSMGSRIKIGEFAFCKDFVDFVRSQNFESFSLWALNCLSPVVLDIKSCNNDSMEIVKNYIEMFSKSCCVAGDVCGNFERSAYFRNAVSYPMSHSSVFAAMSYEYLLGQGVNVIEEGYGFFSETVMKILLSVMELGKGDVLDKVVETFLDREDFKEFEEIFRNLSSKDDFCSKFIVPFIKKKSAHIVKKIIKSCEGVGSRNFVSFGLMDFISKSIKDEELLRFLFDKCEFELDSYRVCNMMSDCLQDAGDKEIEGVFKEFLKYGLFKDVLFGPEVFPKCMKDDRLITEEGEVTFSLNWSKWLSFLKCLNEHKIRIREINYSLAIEVIKNIKDEREKGLFKKCCPDLNLKSFTHSFALSIDSDLEGFELLVKERGFDKIVNEIGSLFNSTQEEIIESVARSFVLIEVSDKNRHVFCNFFTWLAQGKRRDLVEGLRLKLSGCNNVNEEAFLKHKRVFEVDPRVGAIDIVCERVLRNLESPKIREADLLNLLDLFCELGIESDNFFMYSQYEYLVENINVVRDELSEFIKEPEPSNVDKIDISRVIDEAYEVSADMKDLRRKDFDKEMSSIRVESLSFFSMLFGDSKIIKELFAEEIEGIKGLSAESFLVAMRKFFVEEVDSFGNNIFYHTLLGKRIGVLEEIELEGDEKDSIFAFEEPWRIKNVMGYSPLDLFKAMLEMGAEVPMEMYNAIVNKLLPFWISKIAVRDIDQDSISMADDCCEVVNVMKNNTDRLKIANIFCGIVVKAVDDSESKETKLQNLFRMIRASKTSFNVFLSDFLKVLGTYIKKEEVDSILPLMKFMQRNGASALELQPFVFSDGTEDPLEDEENVVRYLLLSGKSKVVDAVLEDEELLAKDYFKGEFTKDPGVLLKLGLDTLKCLKSHGVIGETEDFTALEYLTKNTLSGEVNVTLLCYLLEGKFLKEWVVSCCQKRGFFGSVCGIGKINDESLILLVETLSKQNLLGCFLKDLSVEKEEHLQFLKRLNKCCESEPLCVLEDIVVELVFDEKYQDFADKFGGKREFFCEFSELKNFHLAQVINRKHGKEIPSGLISGGSKRKRVPGSETVEESKRVKVEEVNATNDGWVIEDFETGQKRKGSQDDCEIPGKFPRTRGWNGKKILDDPIGRQGKQG